MIITVTLNPALDKTATVGALNVGELNRLHEVSSDAGGKGINVSKMLLALDFQSVAIGFLGGKSGEEILDKLEEMGIDCDFTEIREATRTNLKIIDTNSALTEINEVGPDITPAEFSFFVIGLHRYMKRGNILILSGSTPICLGDEIYGMIISSAHKSGTIVFLDADGNVFREALRAKPYFIKPNLHELKEYFNVKGDLSLEQIIDLCKKFLDMGVKTVALTMGKDGALLLQGDRVLFAKGLDVTPRSTVGAGDSFVGAFAYGVYNKMSLEDTFSLAVAASAGAVTTSGTKAPDQDLVYELQEQVKIIDLSK
ncbi:MAG: 1-phosphofructokinase [Elusimicrobiota bacterium]|jgi:1-phosphofructokinase|nr:1-phosphofructokinase [Elusimicrobiota bacterium]